MISIRFATEDDAEDLLSIYSYYVENTAISFEWDVPSEEEFRERIRATLRLFPYIVAYDGSSLAGYAYASAFNHRKAYEWCAETSIYVRKDSRKQGIGKMLYLSLEKILSRQGIRRLYACIAYSETVQKELDSNSYCFHKALGYKEAGLFPGCGYKFGKWFDMVWMEKDIAAGASCIPSDIIPFPEIRCEYPDFS